MPRGTIHAAGMVDRSPKRSVMQYRKPSARGIRIPPSLYPAAAVRANFGSSAPRFFFVFFFFLEGVFNGTLIREPKKTTASDRELQACFSESETNLAIF
jgi:hypothetical protein